MLIGCFLWQITNARFDEVESGWCWEWNTVELPEPCCPPHPPLSVTTPKRNAAPSRWLMKGLGWVWPGSGLGGRHSPKQRPICRCHNMLQSVQPFTSCTLHRLSSGTCKGSSSAACAQNDSFHFRGWKSFHCRLHFDFISFLYGWRHPNLTWTIDGTCATS